MSMKKGHILYMSIISYVHSCMLMSMTDPAILGCDPLALGTDEECDASWFDSQLCLQSL